MEIICHHFKILSSTNDWVKSQLKTLPTNTMLLVTAEEQTAARGQYGRHWVSPKGENIYASFGFFVNENLARISHKFSGNSHTLSPDLHRQDSEAVLTQHCPHYSDDGSQVTERRFSPKICEKCGLDPLQLTHLLAISAAHTLQKYEITCRIKWPNDLIANQKKIAGILCETESQPSQLGIALGIGLNVNMTQKTLSQINQPATSMFLETGQTHNIQAILTALVEHFTSNLTLYLQKGFTPFQFSFQKLSYIFSHDNYTQNKLDL